MPAVAYNLKKMDHVRLAVLGIGCFAVHQLLSIQYMSQCQSSWFAAAFSIDPSPMCTVLQKGMQALRWVPLGALLRAPDHVLRGYH